MEIGIIDVHKINCPLDIIFDGLEHDIGRTQHPACWLLMTPNMHNLIMLVEINVCFLLYLFISESLCNSTDDSWNGFITRITCRNFYQDMSPFIVISSFIKIQNVHSIQRKLQINVLSYATFKKLQYGKRIFSTEWVLLFGRNAQLALPHSTALGYIERSKWNSHSAVVRVPPGWTLRCMGLGGVWVSLRLLKQSVIKNDLNDTANPVTGDESCSFNPCPCN